ncbi:alpha/beta fold hydrolase [Couchioplanes azureus]|uniref:alpha/beta fold hydrolase n=1 Tax=Couchioplanes caeruleus TaxID=56438 RepID=UPI0016714C43|nr:alpha/beta fold hydrolase [Couchioplanes caeruleus]GGQ85619.1 putative hydrolase [Couchioplanes caeruleus subsp. azureus]
MESFASDGYRFDVIDVPAVDGSSTGQTCVLLHGFPEDRHCWDAVAPALAGAGYRVLAPDLRGYSAGARPVSRRAYTLSRLAGDVLALADAAGVKRFHVVGHDWGAALAWYLAGHHPRRVISVGALSVPHPEAFLRALVSSSQAVRSWYMVVFQLPGLPELALSRRGGRAMRAALLRTGLDPASADRYASRAADRAAMRGPLNWYRALPFGLRDRTARIDVPALFLWSDGDRFISRAAAELCGRYVDAPYRFEVLRGASHWLPEEKPEQVAELLIEHFARVAN